jgi:hypothetical protein
MWISAYFNFERSIGEPAKLLANPASRSSRAPSQASRLRESMSFKGDFRQWEELLRVGDREP